MRLGRMSQGWKWHAISGLEQAAFYFVQVDKFWGFHSGLSSDLN
jgi:hypothetical protein